MMMMIDSPLGKVTMKNHDELYILMVDMKVKDEILSKPLRLDRVVGRLVGGWVK